MTITNYYRWTGALGSDWRASNSTPETNWVLISDPSAPPSTPGGAGDSAVFDIGGDVDVTGSGSAEEIQIANATDLTFSSGHYGAGEDGSGGLIIDEDAGLTISSGVTMADGGSLDIVGLTGEGSLTVQAGGGFDALSMFVGADPGAAGEVTVDAADFLIAQSGPGASNGVLTVGSDGDGSIDVSDGSQFYSATAILGANADSTGDVTVSDSIWSGNSLTIGGAGVGVAKIRGASNVAFTTIAIGASGDLDVSAAGGVTNMVLTSSLTLDDGKLSVSGGGQVVIGGAAGVSGAVDIGGDFALVGLGTVNANVVVEIGGAVEAGLPLEGVLTINGNVSGVGKIEPLQTLEVNGAISAGVEIAFNPNGIATSGELMLDAPRSDQGAITGFATGNTIDVRGLLYSTAVFTQGASGNPGTLTLSGGGSAPLALAVEGDYASDNFAARPDATDTIVTLVPSKITLTPLNDTYQLREGSYSIDGDGGTDTFSAGGVASGGATVSVDPAGDVVFADRHGDFDELERFTYIDLADATITIAGNVLTQNNADGSKVVSTFNITGQEYSSKVVTTGADGLVESKLFEGITGQGNLSSFEQFFGGGNLIRTDEFFTGITDHAYTGEEADYDGGGNLLKLAFTGVTSQAYSSYEYDYVAGLYAGSKFNYASSGAAYSSYEVDYDFANKYAGVKFFFDDVTGQSFTNEEADFDANGALSKIELTGFSGQPYSEIDQFYNGGIFAGEEVDYPGITGASYTSVKVDTDASGNLSAVEYGGVKGGGNLSTIQVDYSGGAVTDTIYGFKDVTGDAYNAYFQIVGAAGNPAAEIFKFNNGSTRIIGQENNLTLPTLTGEDNGGALGTSISGGDYKITAGGSGDTFTFAPLFEAATITDFGTYATNAHPDIVSLSTSDFANFAALLAAAKPSSAGGANTTILSSTTHDALTLNGVTVAQLANLSGDFTFHS